MFKYNFFLYNYLFFLTRDNRSKMNLFDKEYENKNTD